MLRRKLLSGGLAGAIASLFAWTKPAVAEPTSHELSVWCGGADGGTTFIFYPRYVSEADRERVNQRIRDLLWTEKILGLVYRLPAGTTTWVTVKNP